MIIDQYINATQFNINTISATINTYKGELSPIGTDISDNKGTYDTNIAETQNVTLKCLSGTPTGICDDFKIDTNCSNNNSMSVQ